MRRSDREVTQRDEIEKMIAACKICRLGFITGTDVYIVPLNFGYQDGVLYFHSAREGKKVELLKQSPRVCFEMDRIKKMITSKDACEWGVEYESVIGYGDARIIDTPGIRALGLWQVSPEEVAYYFPELAELAQGCRFRNCTHIHEPHCAVQAAVGNKDIPLPRYESYLRIRASLESETGMTPGRRLAGETPFMSPNEPE